MTIFFDPELHTDDASHVGLGDDVTVVTDPAAFATTVVASTSETLVVFGAGADAQLVFDFAAAQRVQRPALGVILVRRRVDATLLSHALRAGVREVVRQDDHTALAEACQRSRTVSRQVLELTSRSTDADGTTRPGQILTVFSAKGGCGKTTLATNLAAALVAERLAVCLVDLDLAFGDVAITMQLFPEHTLADTVPMAGHLDEMGVRSIVTKHPTGLDALLAPLDPASAENITPSLVTDLLHRLRRMYDVVVVDTPPSFTEQVLAALDATDAYLLVTTLDIPALKNLKLTLEMLGILGYPVDKQHIVLNRSDSRVGLTVSDVAASLKRPIAAEIPSSRDVPAAVNRGALLTVERPNHPVSAAIRSLRPVASRRENDATSTSTTAAPSVKSRRARGVRRLRHGEVPA